MSKNRTFKKLTPEQQAAKNNLTAWMDEIEAEARRAEVVIPYDSAILERLSKLPIQIAPKPSARDLSPAKLPAVSLNPPQVTIGDTPYAVSAKGASLLLSLVQARGEWINGSLVVNQASRIVSRLPEPVRKLVDSKAGKGFRLKRQG